jgi:cytoskeletal protein CcmA (bactofilin family)
MSEPAAAASVPRPVTTTTSDQATIGKSLVIKGEVTGSESLYIDGRVEGSISLAGNRVTVGRNGVVAANINAREIVVLGKVRGNLTASDRVDIRSDGSLTGDVVAARISIEDGAFFKGGIDIRKAGQQPGQKDKRRRSKGRGCLGRTCHCRTRVVCVRPDLSSSATHGTDIQEDVRFCFRRTRNFFLGFTPPQIDRFIFPRLHALQLTGKRPSFRGI